MKKIFVVEEHHEALIPWLTAAPAFQAPRAMTLIHVDAHADMDLPVSCRAIEAAKTPADLIRLAYSELDIQTFIAAAVWRGACTRVIWIRPWPGSSAEGQTWLWEDQGGNGHLCMGRQPPPGSGHRSFAYRWTSLEHPLPLAPDQPVVLDIDLDFFAGGQRPTAGQIELSREEYDRIRTTPRHFLRCHFGGRLRTMECQGRYYCVLTPLDGAQRRGTRQVSNAEAAKTIGLLEQRLLAAAVNPELVTVCRSRGSGFCPADQWQFLEQQTLAMLERLYGPLDLAHIDALVAHLRSEADA